MTAKNAKPVPASEVRAWLLSDKGQTALKDAAVATEVGARGRIEADQREVFHKHNPRKFYEQKGEAQKPHVEVPGVVMLDGAGRKTTRTVTITTEQGRTLLGQPTSRKGRFSKATLAAALSAVEADKVADSFTKSA